ncbi:hypothetical protein FEM48_Zijuj12G0210500 [Ziziphus jujuba var. spinosa]|uniref:Uncharacterized protein n=1 Tax=Ziziphus jujuba var. spinosa TaxID=714518 RepID=A0A978UFJ1_ZIZJJ|nr:hypothetical protein FEM48_Zijuj12G0210500 [Ziziphus jujuba var. spinosa]
MGKGKSASLFSFCNIFKACFSSGSNEDAYSEEGYYIRRRIYASDEDRGGWTAEPGIDRKASAFIASMKLYNLALGCNHKLENSCPA